MRSWLGATNDSALIRQAKQDMRDWTRTRIIWVGHRGFTSAENRRALRAGDHHYILAEKLRSGSEQAKAALGRAGRYAAAAGRLWVKRSRLVTGSALSSATTPTPRSGTRPSEHSYWPSWPS